MSKKYKGLSSQEAQELIDQYGFNEVKEQNVSFWKKILEKFLNPITLMIEVALFLSLIAKDYQDAFIIFILLLVNVLVESFQEFKTDSALRELKKNLATTAVVLRDGEFKRIDTKYIVPSDIVKLSIGDIAPADAKVIDSEMLEMDQSTITGESLPQSKKIGDDVFAGSVVKVGSAIIKVTATAKNTRMGESENLIAESVHLEASHFQKAIFAVGRFLILLSTVLVFVVAISLYFRGDDFIEILKFSLVLIVASIPVALPVVLSVLMALGALRLAKKNAVVKNFVALEELAGVSVLAVDKTGTLTQNTLTVKNPIVFNNYSQEDLFVFAIFASENENKNAIEQAIENYARQEGYFDSISKYTELKFTPFNPKNKTTDVTIRDADKEIFIIMGATERIAQMIPESDVKSLKDETEKIAKDGFRALAVAAGKDSSSVSLVGILPLYDPPRSDSKTVVSQLKKLRITIKMITGDNPAIAKYIAQTLDIGKKVASAENLKSFLKLPSKEFYKKIVEIPIFAGVIPFDKFQIIDTLQKNNHIVAMTGDGVNDAPALKKADVGIAVRGATPAARAAADLVLLSSGLAPIRIAMEEARKIFAKMRSYATFRITETIRIIFFITFSLLLFNFSPLTPTMIILLALLNDIPIMMLTYDNAPISRTPIRWNIKETIIISIVMGMTGLISSFLLLWFLDYSALPVAIIQTIMFLKLDIAGHSTLYTTRTYDKHFWARPFPSLKFFIPAFASRMVGVLLALFGVFVEKVSLEVILAIWIYATLSFLFTDFVKVWAFRLFRFLKIF